MISRLMVAYATVGSLWQEEIILDGIWNPVTKEIMKTITKILKKAIICILNATIIFYDCSLVRKLSGGVWELWYVGGFVNANCWHQRKKGFTPGSDQSSVKVSR